MDIFTFIAILIVGGPIAKAVARRISRPPEAGSAELGEALEQTERRLEDTERQLVDTQDRLAEVEERLDFAERLLARQKAREQLGP
jgi:septal ring factor EnvC (AmiA/AmiB activator)